MTVLPSNILRCMPKEERKRMGKAGSTWDEMMERSNAKMEGELHKQISNLLNQRMIRFVGHSRYGVKSTYTPGAPDFLFVYKGLPYAFEAKIGNKQPDEEQLNCHCRMRKDGWLVFVVRNLEQAREFLDGKPQVLE